ncbi:MAG: CRISPR-associated endonuclease Cas2 [Ignavibacteriales bacterium CG12_big_fil_rev_8_21_14_0_65_30_8]|nr:MAG: CRISPR-associated endonuclease Cas2 [Ignavibacteriales bacterium CG12_big_fil_rev_8_21_14_0_65_30_8]
MICIVTYKAAKTGVKISKLLLNYGTRINNSVFECRLNYKYFLELKSKIELLSNKLGKGEYIKIFPLCEKCRKNITSYGDSKEDADPLFYLV